MRPSKKRAYGPAQHPNDAEAQFLLGSVYAFKSGYEFSIAHARLSASEDAGRTFDVLRELVRRYPDSVDSRVITGAFSIIADSLDLKTKWLAWLLGYRGNLEGGRRDLELVAQKRASSKTTMLELCWRLFIRASGTSIERKTKAFLELHARYPENYLVHLDIAAVEMLSNRPLRAIDTYRQILAKDYPATWGRATVLSRLGDGFPDGRRFGGIGASVARSGGDIDDIASVVGDCAFGTGEDSGSQGAAQRGGGTI